MNHLAVRVASCSRSWKGVHRRGEGSRRLGIDRKGDRGALGLFVLGAGSMPNETVSMLNLRQLIAL